MMIGGQYVAWHEGRFPELGTHTAVICDGELICSAVVNARVDLYELVRCYIADRAFYKEGKLAGRLSRYHKGKQIEQIRYISAFRNRRSSVRFDVSYSEWSSILRQTPPVFPFLPTPGVKLPWAE